MIIRIFSIIIGLVKCMNILHLDLKWLIPLQLSHVLPQAGHLSLCFSCLYPQNLPLNFNFSLPLCEVLFIWEPFLPPGVLVSEVWVILFTLEEELGRVALSLNSLTCHLTVRKLYKFLLLCRVSNCLPWGVILEVFQSQYILFCLSTSDLFPQHCTRLLSFLAPWEICRTVPGMECFRICEIRWLHCHAGCSIFPMLLKLYRVYLYRHHLSK